MKTMECKPRSSEEIKEEKKKLFSDFYKSLDNMGKRMLKRDLKDFHTSSRLNELVTVTCQSYNYDIVKRSRRNYHMSFVMDSKINSYNFTMHEIIETIKKIEGI